MVKEAQRYKSTGGWGYDHFDRDDKTSRLTNAERETCAACHAKAPVDHVFVTSDREARTAISAIILAREPAPTCAHSRRPSRVARAGLPGAGPAAETHPGGGRRARTRRRAGRQGSRERGCGSLAQAAGARLVAGAGGQAPAASRAATGWSRCSPNPSSKTPRRSPSTATAACSCSSCADTSRRPKAST